MYVCTVCVVCLCMHERLNASPLKINEIICIPSFKSICTYCLECMYDRLPQNDELSAELLDNISGKFAAPHTYIHTYKHTATLLQ